MQVSPLLDFSLPTAVRQGSGGVRAWPPAAAKPAPLLTWGEPPQAARSSE